MKRKRIHYGVAEVLENPSENAENNVILHSEHIPPYIEGIVISVLEKEYGEYIFLDRERLENVECRLNEVEERLDDLEGLYKNIIIVEEMDMETAKQKILDYTEKHKVFDVEELHRNIRCDLGLLIKILDDLKKEGRIDEET